ncbi:hypothetical protein [Halorarius halobius]|uniref:hypothetical protein n=1 Tax=Halorarius halobius TaxID=2962671 RepID=UPI0020CC432C|nr:hypothetical protein [Halorarius halobius]
MSAVTRWTYLGLAMLAVGFLAAGSGAATHLHEQQCQGVQFTTVTPVNGTNATAGEAVAYRSLSETEREVFREALAADGQVLTRRGALTEGVVSYDGQRYRVRTRTDRGCTPWHPTRVVGPLAGGVALLVVGTLLTRGRGGGERPRGD